MSFIAWVMVWHAWLPLRPQQAVSAPVVPSTLRMSPLARPLQQAEFVVSQKSPVTQLELSVQPTRHAVMPQTNGVQSTTVGGAQLPRPSQKVGLVCVEPMQPPAPQDTVVSGRMQAPVLSQSLVPQGGTTFGHAAVQQWPFPLTPQTPDPQASFTLQGAPGLSGVTQLPPAQTNPVSQSAVTAQVVLQLVASAQIRLPGQRAGGVCAAQVPLASQALEVSELPLQLSVPQADPEG